VNMKASIKFTWNKKLKDYLLRRVVASYSGRSIAFYGLMAMCCGSLSRYWVWDFDENLRARSGLHSNICYNN